MSVAAPTDTAIFHAFVEQVLAPALRDRPGALVVMDNLGPHKAAVVHEAIRAAGLGSRLLPRYSPDLNPIEPCWSKIKTLLRAREARSLDDLDRELHVVKNPGQVMERGRNRGRRGTGKPSVSP